MTRSDDAWREMNEPVIAQFRANQGRVNRKYPVILLTTTGAQSGKPHCTPLNFSRDDDRLVVVASKGGSSRHPDWYSNLVDNPEVTIEDGGEEFRARAVVTTEPERTRLYDRHAALMPFFDGYRRRVKSRQIPVVVFERLYPSGEEMAGPNSVEEYMAGLPDEARRGFEDLRRTIKAVAPAATEGISYKMPVFRVNDAPIVWIAAYKHHYSLYPATEGLERALGDELKPYLSGKGTIRFAADKPIPKRLVRKIVKARLAEGSLYRR